MVDWVPFALVGGICLVIGFLVASLIYSLRRPAEHPAQAEPPEEGLEEVLRLWRRKSDGGLFPELGGQSFPSAAGLDAERHADLSLALVDIHKWLSEAPYAAAVAPPAPAPAKSPPEEAPAQVAASTWQALEHISEETPRTSLNPFRPFFQAARREPRPRPATPETSIASQIDEILQGKLASSDFADRGIRLIEWPVSGMRILVGMSQYDQIDDIPDPEIKHMIQEAVAEWEARMLRNGSA